MLKLFLSFTLLLYLFVPTVPGVQQDEDQFLLSPKSFSKVLKKKKKQSTLIDVRTPAEFDVEHLPGAINIDFMSAEFKDEVGNLDKEKTYLVYCRTGKRSSASQKIMNEAGLKQVFDLNGGIKAWKESGNKVVHNGQ